MGLLLVDGRGLIVRINARALAMFGYEEAELIGTDRDPAAPSPAPSCRHPQGYIAAPSIRAMGKGRDLTGRRKDGIEFPPRNRAKPAHRKTG
jgi:PAS domain S-box-containing protein